MAIEKQPIYKKLLKADLEKRCGNNPRYSLRSYAQSLGISPGILSQILNGKRALSLQMAKSTLDKIELSPKESKAFLDSVVREQRSRSLKRRDPEIRNYKESQVSLSDLSLEYYKFISEWYYIAILELTQIKSFKASPAWIASRLGITAMEAKIAIERLLELGLLEKKNKTLVKSQAHLRLKDMYTATSSARRKRQKQIRYKAIEAIDEQEISNRSMTTMTFGVDPKLIPGAKKLIEKFNESLVEYFEQGSKKEVYTLEVGLFSLQKSRRKK